MLSLLLERDLVEVMVGIVEGFSSALPGRATMKAALSARLRPQKESVGRAKAQMEPSRGFAVFDGAASKGQSLDVFLSRWRAFRAGASPVPIDDLVAAGVAGDLAKLGAWISERDAATIHADAVKLR
jgi:hypothetical protein